MWPTLRILHVIVLFYSKRRRLCSIRERLLLAQRGFWSGYNKKMIAKIAYREVKKAIYIISCNIQLTNQGKS